MGRLRKAPRGGQEGTTKAADALKDIDMDISEWLCWV